MERSTISGNTAESGGIYSSTHHYDFTSSKTTITNPTISGNAATSSNGHGGGVYNIFGLTEIENSTITDNTATGPLTRSSGYP